jgi:hypothetical protein
MKKFELYIDGRKVDGRFVEHTAEQIDKFCQRGDDITLNPSQRTSKVEPYENKQYVVSRKSVVVTPHCNGFVGVVVKVHLTFSMNVRPSPVDTTTTSR